MATGVQITRDYVAELDFVSTDQLDDRIHARFDFQDRHPVLETDGNDCSFHVPSIAHTQPIDHGAVRRR